MDRGAAGGAADAAAGGGAAAGAAAPAACPLSLAAAAPSEQTVMQLEPQAAGDGDGGLVSSSTPHSEQRSNRTSSLAPGPASRSLGAEPKLAADPLSAPGLFFRSQPGWDGRSGGSPAHQSRDSLGLAQPGSVCDCFGLSRPPLASLCAAEWKMKSWTLFEDARKFHFISFHSF